MTPYVFYDPLTHRRYSFMDEGIYMKYILHRPHGVYFDVVVFKLSSVTMGHLNMLLCL